MRQVLSRGPRATAPAVMFLAARCGMPGIGRSIASSDTRLWTGLAFIAAFAAAAFVLAIVGVSERGIDDALLVTGRLSFVLFWLAYVGGAAAATFGPAFESLKRGGRNFGLAFASAHVVHLGLVAWLCFVGAAPPLTSFIFFGIAVLWTYGLALVSVDRLQATLGRQRWRLLSFLGLNYIAVAFAVDFLRFPPDTHLRYVVGYLPFVVFAVGGPALRIWAWAARFISVANSVHFDR